MKPSLTQVQLFESLHNSRLEDVKTFNKRSYRGVWSSIVDKYPESAHFVYELLQNADDAEATEVLIVLKPDQLWFKHNGKKHFDITAEDSDLVGDINSITGIGDSSKTDAQNKIGKFGVGFKAVFQYTETPEIFDDIFKFKIENYIVPTLLDHDHPERKDGETLFVFPFKDKEKSYKEIKQRLDNLKNPILFLRNLQRIVWRIETNSRTKAKESEYSKELIDNVDFENGAIKLEHFRLKEPNSTKEIFLFSESIIIHGKDKHLINVGFYYDAEKKSLITNTTENIFCFFPTKETFKSCFVAHAPFLLTDNRQNLKPGERLNTDLIGLLADLAAKSVLYLRDYGIQTGTLLINENLTEIIPNYRKNSWQDLDETFEEPIDEAFKKLISEERMLLSRNNKYLSVEESYIGGSRELVALISHKQLVQLREYEYDEDDEHELFHVKNIDFLKKDLAQNIGKVDNGIYEDINEYTARDFASDISEQFMSLQDVKWVSKFYTFLRTHAITLWKLGEPESSYYSLLYRTNHYPFRKAPIIKTQKGKWVAPFINDVTPNVYIPLKKDNGSNYNFIAEEYVQNENAMKFFRELELKEPDESDYIHQVILSKYTSLNEADDLQDYASDIVVIANYYNKLNERDKKEFIDSVKTKYIILGEDGFLYEPKTIYLKSDFLQRYYSKSYKQYLNIKFYNKIAKEQNCSILITFLLRLGVHDFPQVLKKYKRYWELNQRIKDTISYGDISESHIEDFELEGFTDYCSNGKVKKEDSLYIWNTLLPILGFSSFEHLAFVYRRKYARTHNRSYHTSTFKDLLIHSKWIIDVYGKTVSPAETALEDLPNDYQRNNGLIQFLGIEKREKTIIELGGTQEQQDAVDFGRKMKNAAGDLTEEEAAIVLAQAAAKKKAANGVADSFVPEEQVQTPLSSEEALPQDQKPRKKSTTKKKIEDTQEDSFIEIDDSASEPIAEEDSFARDELRETSLDNTFVDKLRPQKTNKTENNENDEAEVDDVMQKLIEQEEKHNHIKDLRKVANSVPKYSKEWFDALIELEYRGNADTSQGDSAKAINIVFSSVAKEKGSERIYIFKNPSRSIPLWMEEIGDIEVKCAFTNRDSISIRFEVANVRNNSLCLKASVSYQPILDKIEWSKCTKASITLKNQIDLMGKVRACFNSLGFKPGFNLKQGLRNDLKFIFGPPGTGKTTTLAKRIISQMNSSDSQKILVLAPTNTACDEIARKIIECSDNNCPWVYRFVSAAEEDLECIVADRESCAHEEDKCCIISTMARLSFDGFNGIDGFHRLTDIVWDMVICDEASMIPLAEMAITVYNFVNIPIVIAGDPMQIKPIVSEEAWQDENIYTMVKLDRFDNPKTEPVQFEIENLGMQYRSVPAIGQLYSEYAYDGKLKHYRSIMSKSNNFGTLNFAPITFVQFRVERFDSIFGVKKLDGSNVHIYSVLLTLEMVKYICKHQEGKSDEEYTIGIVCPYAPQAQLIESLISQSISLPQNISITVGTVHRFQGGQCNLMFVVLNPPKGLKSAPERIFLNNKNILNVAISRAQDNLCILLPHRDTEGYENLYEINALGRIAQKDKKNISIYTSDQIEEVIFGRMFFIENNTFITSHQLANVYSKAAKRYEVRIDENSVDIQLGVKSNSTVSEGTHKEIDSAEEELNSKNADSTTSAETTISERMEQQLPPIPKKEEEHVSASSLSKSQILAEIEASRGFNQPDQYYNFFERVGIDLDEAIRLLFSANSMCSAFVLIQVFGNDDIRRRFGWREPTEKDIKLNKTLSYTYRLSKKVYSLLFNAVRTQTIPIKGLGNKFIKDIHYEEFQKCFEQHNLKQESKPKLRTSPFRHSYSSSSSTTQQTGKLYSDFEYGLSDW